MASSVCNFDETTNHDGKCLTGAKTMKNLHMTAFFLWHSSSFRSLIISISFSSVTKTRENVDMIMIIETSEDQTQSLPSPESALTLTTYVSKFSNTSFAILKSGTIVITGWGSRFVAISISITTTAHRVSWSRRLHCNGYLTRLGSNGK